MLSSNPLIEVVGLCKQFDTVTAVDDLSIEVRAHEVLGMVGVNGAGKTTCLRMLSGILPATSGSIRIAGELMTGDSVEARRRLAFVPDTPMLFDSLTVMEHLIFVAELYGVEDPAPRIDALLGEFELDDRRNEPASALSRGMRQKLAICCAFLHEPEVLLLDEPLTGLDPAGRRRMCDAISLRARNGSAVIVSSHQLEIVERLSTRFLIVHGGREMVCGSLADIRAALDDTEGEMSLEDLFLRATGLGSERTVAQDGELDQAGDAP